jgi:putative phosphoribosyl transferase
LNPAHLDAQSTRCPRTEPKVTRPAGRRPLRSDDHAGESVGVAKTVSSSPDDVRVESAGALLSGDLVLPEATTGIVAFAHGSGSSRQSPRNQFVASALAEAGLGTLLIDLLTSREETRDDVTGELRFDIGFLTRRLTGIVDWLAHDERTDRLAIGLFGASTGAAAALRVAAERPRLIRAVVSRGGRPDLASEALPSVRAPTLLIVGGADHEVLVLNRVAFEQLRKTTKELRIVPGATHLFEESGALEAVAQLACGWFLEHLAPAAVTESRGREGG